MLVTPFGPAETIDWFERVDRQHEILCFMISADPEHRRALTGLAQNYIDADVALGEKVAFILFGSDDARSYPEVAFYHGRRKFLPGEPLVPRALRHARFGTSDADATDDPPSFGRLADYQANMLAADTTAAAAEWMSLAGIKRESLPVLCTFIKGGDPVIISLTGRCDVSTILKFFGHLADIAERRVDDAYGVTVDAESRMKRAVALARTIEKLEQSLRDHMDAICNRFKATPEERVLIAEFVARQTYDVEALNKTLAECRFSAAADFNSNTTVRGARNQIKKLAQAHIELEEYRPREAMVLSVSEALSAINARGEETQRLVQKLASEGIEARSVEKKYFGVTYDKYAARANQTATLIEKLAKFAGVAKGIGVIADLLK